MIDVYPICVQHQLGSNPCPIWLALVFPEIPDSEKNRFGETGLAPINELALIIALARKYPKLGYNFRVFARQYSSSPLSKCLIKTPGWTSMFLLIDWN
jgi:hypothetical protein